MNKNVTLIDYEALYRLTDSATPLEGDCGDLCGGGVCCRESGDRPMGMYLFPGEECMFTGTEDWLRWELRDPAEDGFPASWTKPVHFVRCTKPCPRERRPLACRFFPLTPHLLRDGTLLLIHETLTLPYTCPLIARKVPLRPDFIDAVSRCWRALLKEPRIRHLVTMDSRERENKGRQPHIVWWGTL
ncbi:MAG: hypothetical protein K6T80_06690 [Firmicutes bacterium]|nr:hypothetical protein [Bacillota bacterium]